MGKTDRVFTIQQIDRLLNTQDGSLGAIEKASKEVINNEIGEESAKIFGRYAEMEMMLPRKDGERSSIVIKIWQPRGLTFRSTGPAFRKPITSNIMFAGQQPRRACDDI
jgi:hypothetical protein